MEEQNIKRKIKNSALALLARREHSLREINDKLKVKFAEQDAILSQVLTELVESEIISDRRYAEIYIRSRSNKGFGPDRVGRELASKGVAKLTIDESLAQSQIAWSEVAKDVWQKKFHLSPIDAKKLCYKDKTKQMTFLRYRGFSQNEIEQIFTDLGEYYG